MLLQDIRVQIHESRLGCHASLTGYTTAMKTGTDIPVLAHPPYVSIKRDYVLTWVYCISCGMWYAPLSWRWHDRVATCQLILHDYCAGTWMKNPKFRRISLHIHYCMSSAYILHHMITITCGKRRWMGKDAMVRAIVEIGRASCRERV